MRIVGPIGSGFSLNSILFLINAHSVPQFEVDIEYLQYILFNWVTPQGGNYRIADREWGGSEMASGGKRWWVFVTTLGTTATGRTVSCFTNSLLSS